MNSSEQPINKDELGRAIARGMSEETARKEKNMAKAEKRKETMLHNAMKNVFKNY